VGAGRHLVPDPETCHPYKRSRDLQDARSGEKQLHKDPSQLQSTPHLKNLREQGKWMKFLQIKHVRGG